MVLGILVAGVVLCHCGSQTSIATGPPSKSGDPGSLAAARVIEQGGQAIVQVNARARASLGIQTSPLRAARIRPQVTLPATVVATQGLVSLVAAYRTASAQLRKAQIGAQVAGREYVRLEQLYRHQRNASAKAVEAQAGIYHSDEVDVNTARQTLALAAASIRQNWGKAVEEWVRRGSATLRRVLDRQDVLVEMTVPLGMALRPPRTIQLELPAGGRASAGFVSTFPQVDPRVQGVSFLYLTERRPGLAPGANLVAHGRAGGPRTGVVVPSSALVWTHGRAWAYIATAEGRFIRLPVATNIPTSGGWFVTRRLAPGEPVVTRGAEELWTIEMNPALKPLAKEEGN